MPKNKNAYLRYLIIHSQLKRNKYKYGYPTLEDLLWCLEDEGLKVSSSTVEKDLRFLKYEREAPLVYDHTQRCYRYTRDWEFDIPLTPDDLKIIRMLVHKLEIFGEAREFLMVKDSIERLSSHFELVNLFENERIDKYILFEYSKGFKGKELLAPLYEAIHEHREIKFSHWRYDSDEPTERTLQPYTLKEHRNRWYIIGKEDDKPRIFGVDRITDLTISDRYFLPEKDFYDEIFRVLYDAVGVMAFGYESEDVLLHFTSDKASYIKSLMLHRSQEIIRDDEDGLTVKLHVKVTEEFIMDCILRYGSSVKVLEPAHLAEKVKNIHSRALKMHS